MARPPEDGLVSDEIDLDPPVPVAQPLELPEDIVYAGEHHVVLWRDSGLRAARVSPDGTLVDDIGIRLGPDVTELRAAFTGEDLLIVSRRHDSGQDVIELMRVGADLTPPTADAVELARDDALLGSPRIAFGDGVALVTWGRSEVIAGDTRHDVQLRRVAADGTLLDDTSELGTPFTDDRFPDVAFDGSRFVVAWQRDGAASRLLATRVTTTGDVIDSGGVTLAADTESFRPRLAAGGGQLAAAWRDGAALRATRFSPGMVVLDAMPIDIDTTADSLVSWDIEFDGAGFAVGWRHGADEPADDAIALRRIKLDGTVTEPLVVAGPDAGSPTELAFNGANVLFGWQGRVARVALDDTILDPGGFEFAHRANLESQPAIAAGDERYLVAWRDNRNGANGVYAMVLDADGTPWSDAVRLSSPDVSAFAPEVAFGNGHYAVIWRATIDGDVRALRAARISSDGDVLDPAPLELVAPTDDLEFWADVAIGPAGTLVVWTQQSASKDVFGRIISTDGAVSLPFPISAAANTQRQPRVVADTDGFFVVWEDFRATPVGVFGARVDADGTVLNPLGARLTTDGQVLGVELATTGAHHQLVWATSAAGSAAIKTTAVSLDGVAANPEGLVATTDARQPAVSADGDQFTLVWHERGGDGPVAAMRLTTDGAPAADDGFTVQGTMTSFARTSVAAAQPGQALVVYQAPDGSPGFAEDQVRVRLVTLLDDGTECGDGAGCATGLCIDGVCCDSGCGSGDPTDCQACSAAAGAGVDGTCGPIAAESVCRSSTGACDAAEVCDGAGLECPEDAPAADGTACDDGSVCTNGDVCTTGTCAGATVTCPEPGPCATDGICSTDTGACNYAPVADGTPCDGGTCEAGACVGFPDAGLPDAAVPDAGLPDAGLPDAPIADAGMPDASADGDIPPVPDAGATDAGASDAALPPPPPPTSTDGCGCVTGGERGGLAGTLLVGLTLAIACRARRRREGGN